MRWGMMLVGVCLATSVASGECGRDPFGPAEGYNLFVLGNLDHRNTDTEGRVAVGGDARFHHYSLGQKLVLRPGEPPWALVVGGGLLFTEGTVWAGPVACAGLCTIGHTATVYHGTRRARPIDFVAAEAFLGHLSRTWGKARATGTTKIDGKAISLVGEQRMVNVFEVAGDVLASATYLAVAVTPGSTVVVNVTGKASGMLGFGFKLSGVAAARILYNFFEATDLRFRHVGIEGTVLAPFADVEFSDGVIHGSMIARSLKGSGQVNLNGFTGCLPKVPW